MHHHREQEQEHNQHDCLDHVCQGKHRTRVVGARIVLQQCVHRHQEQTAEKTRERIQNDKRKGVNKERHQEHAHRHANHAHGNEPGFNKVAGLGSRNNRAHHKACNGKCKVILDGIDIVGTGNILIHEHKNLRQSPEHRKGDNRSTKRRHAPTKAQVLFHVLDIHVRVFVLDLGHHKASHCSKHTDTRQNPRNHERFRSNTMNRCIRLERFKIDEVHPHHGKPRRTNNAAKAKNLQKSIRKTQIANAKHLFEDTVFCGTMDSETATQANRKPERHSRGIAGHKNRLGNHKDRHHEGRPCEHLVFRELIGEEPRKKHHKDIGREEEDLQHERLPSLSRFLVHKRSGQNLLGINEHAHLYKGHRKDRQEISNRSLSFPHTIPSKKDEVITRII